MNGSPAENETKLRVEHYFTRNALGNHFEQLMAGTKVVFPGAGVAENFKDSASVHRPLRLLLNLAQRKGLPDHAA